VFLLLALGLLSARWLNMPAGGSVSAGGAASVLRAALHISQQAARSALAWGQPPSSQYPSAAAPRGSVAVCSWQTNTQ
jgi:hypothetical protein